MKVLQINIFGNLSTGRIAVDLYKTLIRNNHSGVIAFARNSIEEGTNYIKIGNIVNVYIDGLLTRLTDKAGNYSRIATIQLIKRIEQYDPDIIHLHNLHGYYINIDILFNYLKSNKKPVVWTLHDCWAYTGHCCYYSAYGCTKWEIMCENCGQKHAYPASYVDRSKENYYKKKSLFTSIPNLHLVTVSKWLEREVRKSFLKNLPIKTIYNGIDLEQFKPTYGSVREKYGLKEKTIILSVASTWSRRKGLEDLIELAKTLNSKYAIVLVGLNNQKSNNLPKNMVTIGRTDNSKELAELYTAADVYVNASVEETFGLTTVEALACGTPVIVYNCTAVPEVVDDTCGFIIDAHNIEVLREIIVNRKYMDKDKEACIQKARCYEKNKQYMKYIDLYEELVKNN